MTTDPCPDRSTSGLHANLRCDHLPERDPHLCECDVQVIAERILASDWLAERERAASEKAWDEGFTRGFYDPLAGHGMSGRDASESAARNPYEVTP